MILAGKKKQGNILRYIGLYYKQINYDGTGSKEME